MSCGTEGMPSLKLQYSCKGKKQVFKGGQSYLTVLIFRPVTAFFFCHQIALTIPSLIR